MEKYYKELYLTDEWDKLMAAKEAGMPTVPCLPLDRCERKLTISEFPYVLEDVDNFTQNDFEKLRHRMLDIPYEIFRTARCIVREICLKDIDRLYEIYAAPEITAYMSDIHENKEDEIKFTRKYIHNRYDVYHYGAWIVEDISSHQVIGRAGLNYKKDWDITELSYMICKERQHEGLAYEVCSAILSYAKGTLPLNTIYARVNETNAASLALINKLGFAKIGTADQDKDGATIIRFRLDLT